jgi:hypothetical protein
MGLTFAEMQDQTDDEGSFHKRIFVNFFNPLKSRYIKELKAHYGKPGRNGKTGRLQNNACQVNKGLNYIIIEK